MKNLKGDAITKSDIEEYLDGSSDFSFELQVLKKLNDLKLSCMHSGTYTDPITGKSREFDIRASIRKEYVNVFFSVECKNLQPNFPLVMHCLRRKQNESYNNLIHTFKPIETKTNAFSISSAISSGLPKETAKRIRVSSENSLYPIGEFVAKSSDQAVESMVITR